MKLYKFRPLVTCCDYDRVLSIINDGFYCCDFLDFNDSNEGVFLVNENSSKVDLDEKLKYKICSFSEEGALESQLMWGHYASAGMGIALEIDVSGSSVFKEVNYGVDINHEYGSIEAILTNKSQEWSYEQERRYLSTNNKMFYRHKIEKIYFGMPYAGLINYNELKIKHRKLRGYLDFSRLLRNECEVKNIQTCDYELSGRASRYR